MVAFREESGHLVLEPDPFAAVLALAGSLKGKGLERMLIEERRKERGGRIGMKHYILDANAVLRYLDPEAPGGNEKMTALFLEAKADASHLMMSVVNLGEVLYTLLKSEPERALQVIRQLQQVLSIGRRRCRSDGAGVDPQIQLQTRLC